MHIARATESRPRLMAPGLVSADGRQSGLYRRLRLPFFGRTFNALPIKAAAGPPTERRTSPFPGSGAGRGVGRAGLVATAISAADAALWDLKGKLLNLPAVSLLGAAREAVPVYGSGGFTTYSIERLQEQLGGWASQGMRWVKMKVARTLPSISTASRRPILPFAVS